MVDLAKGRGGAAGNSLSLFLMKGNSTLPHNRNPDGDVLDAAVDGSM